MYILLKVQRYCTYSDWRHRHSETERRRRKIREKNKENTSHSVFFTSDIKSFPRSLWNWGIKSVMEWSHLSFSLLAHKYCSAVERTGMSDSFTGRWVGVDWWLASVFWQFCHQRKPHGEKNFPHLVIKLCDMPWSCKNSWICSKEIVQTESLNLFISPLNQRHGLKWTTYITLVNRRENARFAHQCITSNHSVYIEFKSILLK